MAQSASPLKPARKYVAVALVILVTAVGVGWWHRQAGEPPKPVVIDSRETLLFREISFREELGPFKGAPDGFECVQTYEVRPIDPTAAFSHPFVLNFFAGKGATDLVVARVSGGTWVEVPTRRAGHDAVTASIEAEEPGIYALGKFK